MTDENYKGTKPPYNLLEKRQTKEVKINVEEQHFLVVIPECLSFSSFLNVFIRSPDVFKAFGFPTKAFGNDRGGETPYKLSSFLAVIIKVRVEPFLPQ